MWIEAERYIKSIFVPREENHYIFIIFGMWGQEQYRPIKYIFLYILYFFIYNIIDISPVVRSAFAGRRSRIIVMIFEIKLAHIRASSCIMFDYHIFIAAFICL